MKPINFSSKKPILKKTKSTLKNLSDDFRSSLEKNIDSEKKVTFNKNVLVNNIT